MFWREPTISEQLLQKIKGKGRIVLVKERKKRKKRRRKPKLFSLSKTSRFLTKKSF